MSNSMTNEMRTKVRKMKQLEREITSWLLDNPCLDDDPQKEEMYRLAICYYKTKREKCQSDANASYNGIMSMRLEVLVDSYNDAEESSKQEYARKIARYLLDETTNYWLRRIPDEIREEAFQIIIEYLEQQMRS